MGKKVPVFNQGAVLQGGIDLRLVWCNWLRLPPGWREGPLRLAPDVTVFVFAGKHRFWANINGVRVEASEGDLVVLRGGDAYTWGGFVETENRILSMGLSLCQLDGRDILGERAFARHYRLRDRAGYRDCSDAIIKRLRTRGTEKSLSVLHAVLAWVLHLLRETGAPVRRNPKLGVDAVQRVLQAEAWAEARLDKPITLAEWARSVGWSPVQFGRVFRMETAYRPMRWLEERRMERASELLLDSSFSVREVSERVGYANPFYFSTVFKKHRGGSPLRYRREGASSMKGTK